jgi:AcrR family transcriptional regulator
MTRQGERSSATIAAILATARKLFAANGFEATSIDEIAAQAGVAKGAIYHHFASKEEIFTQVLEGVQAEIAAAPASPALRQIPDALDRIAAGVLRYLETAMRPGFKRILLIDGPVVIGWGKWREIDDRYFGASTKSALVRALGERVSAQELDAISRLVMGAVMEAALVCAQAEDPLQSARQHAGALRKMLEGSRSG